MCVHLDEMIVNENDTFAKAPHYALIFLYSDMSTLHGPEFSNAKFNPMCAAHNSI